MLGDKARAARARGRDRMDTGGRSSGPHASWHARAAGTQRHSEWQRPRRPWGDVGGVMRACVHGQQQGQRRVVRWPARACKERATARAGSRQHWGEKERGSQRKKKSLEKKVVR
jgi:hypothetical protein